MNNPDSSDNPAAFRYLVGNSPKLPAVTPILAAHLPLSFEHLKVQLELLQEESLLIIYSDKELTPMQISRIEYALLNPPPAM